MNRKKTFKKRIIPKQPSQKNDSLVEKITLAIIVAVFSVIGSFVATFLSKNIEETIWIRDRTYEYSTTILNKRIEIYDRATKVIAMRGIAKALEESIDLYPTLALAEIDSTTSYEHRQEIREMATSLNEITVEYVSVMTLASTYFGPDTKAEIKSIKEAYNPGWWNADDEQFATLLSAMGNELNYGLEYIDLNAFIESLRSRP